MRQEKKIEEGSRATRVRASLIKRKRFDRANRLIHGFARLFTRAWSDSRDVTRTRAGRERRVKGMDTRTAEGRDRRGGFNHVK